MAQGRLLTLLPPPPPESRSTGRDRSEESDVEGMLDDPFDVVPQKKKKEASSVDRLRRWRVRDPLLLIALSSLSLLFSYDDFHDGLRNCDFANAPSKSV